MTKINELTEEIPLEERSKRLFRVAIKDAEHLKKWLEKSGRTWIVLNCTELVDALPFPDGLDAFMQIIACYRDHRRGVPTGEIEVQTDPTLGKEIQVPLMKDENLSVVELDQAIRYLISQVTELDPDWSIERPLG